MRFRIIRRGLTAIVILGLIAAGAFAALSFVASTQIVKDHIALELSRWSGYRVTLGRAPVIRVWPSMHAVLGDVRLSEWGAQDAPIVLSSDIVEVELSAFAALRGKVEPQRIRFVRPLLRLRKEDGRYFMPPAFTGRLGRAVAATREQLREQDVAEGIELPAEPVGIAEFSEGRIVARENGNGSDQELLSSLAGAIQWPAMNRELSFRVAGIWRGENLSLSGVMTSPLLQFAGATGPVRLAIESAPLTGSFNGTLDMSQFDGEVSLTTPSLGRAFEWLGMQIGDELPSGAVTLDGMASGDLLQMKFEQATVNFSGNTGTGTLDLSLDRDIPALSGTLAFDDLDLLHVLGSYSVFPDEPLGSQLADLLNLDLRLSAARAKAGLVSLTDVAAVVQLNDRMVAFDISDSSAFGGNVVTAIRIDRQAGNRLAEFRLLASEIDGSALATSGETGAWLPKARGKISVILKGPLAMPQEFFSLASGSINASFSAGTIGTFDLNSFLERAAEGGFFSLDQIDQGMISFDRAELKATVTDGVADLDKASMSASGHLIEFSGVANYGERSLALAGSVSSADTAAEDPAVTFFAGGSWESPYFSAILPARPAHADLEE